MEVTSQNPDFQKSVPLLPKKRKEHNKTLSWQDAFVKASKRSPARSPEQDYRLLLEKCFGIDLGLEVDWILLPLGSAPPIDPVEFLSNGIDRIDPTSRQVKQLLAAIYSDVEAIKNTGEDPGRYMTVFRVKLESV